MKILVSLFLATASVGSFSMTQDSWASPSIAADAETVSASPLIPRFLVGSNEYGRILAQVLQEAGVPLYDSGDQVEIKIFAFNCRFSPEYAARVRYRCEFKAKDGLNVSVITLNDAVKAERIWRSLMQVGIARFGSESSTQWMLGRELIVSVSDSATYEYYIWQAG